MKKNEFFYAIIVVVALVFVFGCNEGDNAVKEGPFISGVGGVSVEFVQLAPPENFDQGKEVPLKMVLKNKGEYDLVAGRAKVKIYGVNSIDFGLSTGYKGTTGVLSGIGEFRSEGGRQDVDFGKINYKQSIVNSQDFELWAKLCYPYQTKALIDVCMKSTVSEEADEGEICSLAGEKIKGGMVSAGPVQLTSVKQETRGSDQVRFDFVIENKGTGNIYASDALCEDLDDEFKKLESRNKVNVEIVRPLDILCRFASGEDSNKGVVILDSGVGDLSCWKTVDETYEDKLGVVLSYVYTDTITKTVTIYEKV